MANRQGSSSAKDVAAEQQQQPQRDGDYEPVYEWLDAGANYLLRLNVPEFKKEDFQVHVDAAGRLTVRGQRDSLRLHKVFQLPPTSNLDGITGRLEGTVLVLTVPKLPAKPKAEEKEKDANKKVDEDVAAVKPPTDHKAPEPMVAAPATPPPPRRETTARERHDEEEKARAAEHKARIAREADRRIEAARARLAAQAPKPHPAPEPEKKAACWKERAAEGGMKLAEAIGKNKEVVATAVAAFTLGFFISSKLFSRNNN
uniref:SHSP domain-containing protein n=1 Tax=Leersia perrieri TaxID=77586 RepID=A0A0D9V2D7_9ORYZ